MIENIFKYNIIYQLLSPVTFLCSAPPSMFLSFINMATIGLTHINKSIFREIFAVNWKGLYVSVSIEYVCKYTTGNLEYSKSLILRIMIRTFY